MEKDRDDIEISIRDIAEILKRNVLIIVIVAVLFAGAAGVYSFFIAKPVYQSTSKIYILTQTTSITSLADIQMGSSLTNDYLELIKSRPVVNQVKRNLGLDYGYKQLANMITVENPTDTRIVKITATTGDPELSKEITNEFARVSKVQISYIMDTDQPTIVERGVVESNPVKPEKSKNIAIGFLLGAFLSALVVVLIVILNDKINNVDDVEKSLGLTVLGEIPLDAELNEGRKEKRK